MMYLSRFGFGHSSPVMSLAVEQYMEREGHRKYELRCALRLPEAAHSEKKELQAVSRGSRMQDPIEYTLIIQCIICIYL